MSDASIFINDIKTLKWLHKQVYEMIDVTAILLDEYDNLTKKLEIAREALELYAELPSVGEKARAALKKIGEV